MSIPTTRAEFKDYCLRKLGHDVIDINVSEEQIEDRIDEALNQYQSFHFNSYEKVYLAHELTSGDVANTYVSLPPAMKGVTRLFSVSSITGNLGDPLSLNYQIRASDVFFNLHASGAWGVTMLDYYLFKRHMTLIDEMLSGATPVRFNKHMKRLYIDGDWRNVLKPGSWVVIEGQSIIDPDTYESVWSEHWLQEYATHLIMKQWALVLSKYTEVKLLGGITLNGPQMLQYADEKLKELEYELRETYSEPPMPQIG
jgi:hypothetical protein